MIVCVCRAVSDRVIRSTISAGASSVAEVAKACRAGTCCGSCRPTIARMLSESQAQPHHPCEGAGTDRACAGCERRAA